jgi:ribonuclease J
MKKERLDLLLIEGTNINSSSISSEATVKKKVKRIVERTRGLVLAGFAIVDYDRFRTFYEVAKETGRKFVISMKQAYILSKIQSYLSIPEVSDPDIIVFEKDKSSFGAFEREVQAINGVDTIDAKGLNAIQDDVLMYASYYDFNELLTIRPKSGSVYILSQSEPFNEEMEIDYAKMHNWLEHHGLPLFKAHASGHATAHELKEIIEEVDPRKVVPIHTERPKLFEGFVKDLGIDIILPKVGEEFRI